NFLISVGGTYAHANHTYSLKITCKSEAEIPGCWKLEFDLPTTTALTSAWGAGDVEQISTAWDVNRYRLTGTASQAIANGATLELQGMMKLNFSGGPQRFILHGSSSQKEYDKLYGGVTPTPTPSATATATAQPTPTTTATVKPTATPTPTPPPTTTTTAHEKPPQTPPSHLTPPTPQDTRPA
ncbi:hypothetical protein AMQ83_14000, partial [Paenibacillus riograndensis]